MISLEINGINYEYFTKISVRRDFDKIPSDFSFQATTDPDDVTEFPINQGDIVRIMVNDKVFVTGYVDEISIRHSISEHSISVAGSSIAVDLLESTMDASFDIVPPMTLQAALQEIVQKSSLNVSILDNTGETLEPLTENERLTGNLGSTIWSLMVQAALKRNVLLSENGNANIVMNRGQGQRLDYAFEKRVNGSNNNLLSSSLTRTTKGKFYCYKVCSQPNATTLAGIPWEGNEETVFTDPVSESIDTSVRRSRMNTIVAEQSSTLSQCNARAVWQSNVSDLQSLRYQCTHRGYTTSDGLLIEPGHKIFVTDEYVSFASELMIETVTLRYSLDGGSIATYDMVFPDAFTLKANMPTFSETGNDLQGIFDDNETQEFN